MQEYLNSRLLYEQDTGKLFWKFCADMSKSWNTRWAGKEAFTATCGGYRQGRVDGTAYYAHRVIWKMLFGHWPENIDHINGRRCDNRLENLRDVTQAENNRNRERASNNTTGFTGVSYHAGIDKFCASYEHNGTKVNLGYFNCAAAAAVARHMTDTDTEIFHENHGRLARGREKAQVRAKAESATLWAGQDGVHKQQRKGGISSLL